MIVALMLIDLSATVITIMGIKKKIRLIDSTVAKLKAGTEDMGGFISKETLIVKDKYEEIAKTAGEKKAEFAEKKDALAKAVAEKREANAERREELAKSVEEKYTAFVKSLGEKRGERRLMKAFPSLREKRVDSSLGRLREQLKLISEKSEERAAERQKRVEEQYEEKIPEGAEKPFGCGLCFTKLFWLFMIGNVAGFLMETFWAFFIQRRVELRVGLVWGPFIPVYGFGAVIMTLLLYRFYKKRDLVTFAAAAVVGAAFEYFCSLFQELAFGTVSWEYSGTTANIGGRTNLMYALIWGVLGLLWVKDFYPRISKLIEKIPKKIGSPLTVILCVFMIADMFVSGTAVIRRGQRMKGIPANGGYEMWLDKHFDDKYLDFVYPNMIYVDEKNETEADGETPETADVPEETSSSDE
ncbi:MAG: putative ABC transporter permease [Eubacteriales bacterium]